MLVVVGENDEPWGLFSFTEESREVSVAEDYLPGEERKARVSLEVERRQGVNGDIKVSSIDWSVGKARTSAKKRIMS